MCESMGVFVLEVVLEIVYVQVAIRVRLSGRNVEVANDLVDLDATLKTASLLALSVEVFRIVFALALFDALATTE